MAYSMISNKDGTYSMPSSAQQKEQRESGEYAANAAKNAANNSSSNSGRSGSSSNRSSTAQTTGRSVAPDTDWEALTKDPGRWTWFENRYNPKKPYMQAAHWKNTITGEKKLTEFRDIRNDKGKIQKSLLHPYGKSFGADLNKPHTEWKARKKKYDTFSSYLDEAGKDSVSFADYLKGQQAYDSEMKIYNDDLAAKAAAAEKAAEEAAKKAAAKAKKLKEEKAAKAAKEAAEAEQARLEEELAAAQAEATRLRLKAEQDAQDEAERIRLEEEAELERIRLAEEEAEKARLAEEKRLRLEAEEAERIRLEQEAAAKKARIGAAQGVAQDRIDSRGSADYTSAFIGEGASVYIPPGFEVGRAAPIVGPTSVASDSANLTSEVYSPNYIQGAIPQTVELPSVSPAGTSSTAMYENDLGQQIPVTIVDGRPVTYVPPGFTAMAEGGSVGYAEGGDVDAQYQLATKFLGYKGPKTEAGLNDFAKSNPAVGARLGMYRTAMSQGGMARGFKKGGYTYKGNTLPMFQKTLKQTMQPMQSQVSYMTPTRNQFVSPTAGQVYGQAPTTRAATVGRTYTAQTPTYVPASTYQAGSISPFVQDYTERMDGVQGELSEDAQVDAAQGSSSLNINAAQGEATMMENPVTREIQEGELISGVADAEKAAKFAEQIEAASASPSKKATVQGQLEGLMQQFEGGETPAWAAGAMRSAMGQMAARGLGASSMAGQALVQSAMESALPVAMADAQTQSQFEQQNLSNRQQRAMLAAQQRAQFIGQEFDQAFQARVMNSARINDIANMNFTAEQNIALENSRAANTMNLANLSNSQAGVMAEAAAIANMDMANLNNRQQAAVQNAQNFLAMDMSNLDRAQQTTMFKAQQNIQALFTDQAAENAAAQFNATSENQTKQFFSSLASQTSQFNSSQRNATEQFNVNSINSIRQFNSNLQQQRDTFNASNSLVVAQANAQWRQNIATLNTAAQNQSNSDFASAINDLTASNMDKIWQTERDLMDMNYKSVENAKDRAMQMLLGEQSLEALREKIGYEEDQAKSEMFFRFLFGKDFKL